MLNNLEFSSTVGERRLYSLVALILALLMVMSVITFVVVCLPSAGVSSSGIVVPPSDETPGGSENPEVPSYPKVENWINSNDLSGCMIEVGQSAEDMLDINSNAAILVNMESLLALGVKNADKQVQIASMTKVMTLITALDLIETNDQMYEKVTIPQSYIDSLKGYNKAFKAGDEVYVVDLLYSLILRSGCDSALALADHLAGGEAAFVQKMNALAAEIGCENTKFSNSYGRDDVNNYSTVREVGQIFLYALKNELAYKILTTAKYKYYGTEYDYIYSESLVHNNFSGKNTGKVTVLGGKSGNDAEAGYCLVSFGKTENGEKYLVVTAGNKKDASSYTDSAYIYKNYVN